MGLMRAARKFDHRKGAGFGTYANWWVRQSIERYRIIPERYVFR